MNTRKPPLSLRLRKFYKDPVISSILAGILLTLITPFFIDVQQVFADVIIRERIICSPAGKQVNVRKGPSAMHDTLFTLDKGEYFEVLEEGDRDLVLGKTGQWKRISYNDKEGWMFSGFMVCE